MHQGRLVSTVLTVAAAGLLPVSTLWAQRPLDLTLTLSEPVVIDGSAEVLIDLHAANVSEGVLLVDDLPVGEGKGLPSRFVVNCFALTEGEHRLAVWAADEEGRSGWAEVWFLVDNPSVRVTAVDAPTTVWPGTGVEVMVETAGEVATVLVDVGALVGGEEAWLEGEQVRDGRFLFRFEIPPRVLEEGARSLPVRVIGADSDEFLFDQYQILLVAAEPMELGSEAGILVPTSPERQSDEGVSTRLVDAHRELLRLSRLLGGNGRGNDQLRVVVNVFRFVRIEGPTRNDLTRQ